MLLAHNARGKAPGLLTAAALLPGRAATPGGGDAWRARSARSTTTTTRACGRTALDGCFSCRRATNIKNAVVRKHTRRIESKRRKIGRWRRLSKRRIAKSVRMRLDEMHSDRFNGANHH